MYIYTYIYVTNGQSICDYASGFNMNNEWFGSQSAFAIIECFMVHICGVGFLDLSSDRRYGNV